VSALKSPYLDGMSTPPAQITKLLRAWKEGDPQALDDLTPVIYAQLRQLARRRMRNERADHTLQTTALVHEAFLRLVAGTSVRWQDRVHFFAVSARLMRRILIDAARKRGSGKRGGDWVREDHASPVELDDLVDAASIKSAQLCALDDALNALAKIDERRARIVELRFFGGLTVEETAAALDVSPQTVLRDWRLARAWLARELRR
jgi:RNA polymerase sigma factor (TIGR02999 family)